MSERRSCNNNNKKPRKRPEHERAERGKRGKRGHRGHCGHEGATGPTGATGATGPQGQSSAFPDFVPAFKALGATFYDISSIEDSFAPGDIFSFTLDGPNDPIERVDDGTFLLPTAGLYKVSFQIPLNEPTPAQVLAGDYVQATLTAQTIPEGAFIPVPGGVFGKADAGGQIVGTVIVDATYDDFPIRVENTSNLVVTSLIGNPAAPNQRTFNTFSLLPQRVDVFGWLLSRAQNQTGYGGSPGGIMIFDVTSSPKQTSNVEFLTVLAGQPPSPVPNRILIKSSGPCVIKWFVFGRPIDFFTLDTNISQFFAPFVNGNQLIVDSSGSTSANLAAGDEITLRNISNKNFLIQTSIPLPPNLPATEAFLEVYSLNL